jgi:RNA-directed DNA polymerase
VCGGVPHGGANKACEACTWKHADHRADCTSGYRPGTGAGDAEEELSRRLQFGITGYVVEADIKGFFEHIDFKWLIRMLEQRVDDKSFLQPIRKWLKAAILAENSEEVIKPEVCTAQGGSVSPALANVYLH